MGRASVIALGWIVGVIAGVLLGVIVLGVGASVTWLALLLVAGAAGVMIAWSRDAKLGLLYAFVFTAPIAITKSVISHGELYPPYLELAVADIPLALLVLVLAVETILDRKPFWPPAPWSLLLAAALAWACVSAAVGQNRFAGAVGAVNQFRFLLHFAVMYRMVTTPRIVRHVLAAAGAGLGANLLMVAAQMATRSPLALQGAKASAGAQIYSAVEGIQSFRPSGFMLHPNPFAAYLVMLLPIPIVLMACGRKRVGGEAWLCSVILAAGGTFALLLTLSRGGWLSFVVATGFALAVALARGLVPARRILAVVAFSAALAGAMLAAYPTLLYRVTRGDKGSTDSRLVLMDQAAMLIADHPVLGVGLGSYTDAIVHYAPPSFVRLSPEYRDVIRRWIVHNGYLLIWAEKGIVGLLLQLAIILTPLARLRVTKVWWDPALHVIAVGLCAALVGQCVLYLFDQFYQDLRPGVLWLMLGFAAAVFRLQKTQIRCVARRAHPRRVSAEAAA